MPIILNAWPIILMFSESKLGIKVIVSKIHNESIGVQNPHCPVIAISLQATRIWVYWSCNHTVRSTLNNWGEPKRAPP